MYFLQIMFNEIRILNLSYFFLIFFNCHGQDINVSQVGHHKLYLIKGPNDWSIVQIYIINFKNKFFLAYTTTQVLLTHCWPYLLVLFIMALDQGIKFDYRYVSFPMFSWTHVGSLLFYVLNIVASARFVLVLVV